MLITSHLYYSTLIHNKADTIPAPVAPCRRAPPSTACSVRLSIKYVIWLSASLPAGVKKSALSGRGKPPPEWTKVVSKLPLLDWQLVPINWDWGLAKRELTLLAGASWPYLTEAITKHNNNGLVTWQAVITSDWTYGLSKKAYINTEENWTDFAKAAELAYPARAISIRIVQQDPCSIAQDQTMDAKANAMLIMLNGTQEERAPLEQTRARLTANPNAELQDPATPHAVKLRSHHLMKRLERGAPSSEGKFAMHPSGNGWFIRLGHKVLWAWAYKMDNPNVTLDIPPATPLFEWQTPNPSRSHTKSKTAHDSEAAGLPASQVFQPTGNSNPSTLADRSANHTESADASVIGDLPKRQTTKLANDTEGLSTSASSATPLVEVLLRIRGSSSIEILGGMTQYDQHHQNGKPGAPATRRVVTPVNLAGLRSLRIDEKTDQMSEILSISDFPDFCGINDDDFHTKWIIRNQTITNWTHFRNSDKAEIVCLGIKDGPARLICRGVRKIEGIPLENMSLGPSPEL
ncbi:hypothetical protein PCASD_15538 [Puccinia coronata f. sp. avenae]|uniref:Uncharacterized protein n=1 Tax=Puccinia coronata f. sp. avenae TaxID=200324 RepID=A0A2N5U6B8_9BASI|nr:hypothetical protein PCASD_15538 [Puccinia coronata f. sp. avenae]